MKKKKSKQKHGVSKYAQRPIATEKQFELLLKDCFESTTRQLRRLNSRNPNYYNRLGFDPLRIKRKTEAAKNCLSQVMERLSPRYPDLSTSEITSSHTRQDKLFSVSQEWARLCTTPVVSYDILEDQGHLTTAAALWMLDRIKDAGRMEEAISLFPADSDSLLKAEMPDIWDICHGEQVLAGMVYAIQQRNRDCIWEDPKQKPKTKGETEHTASRYWQDDFTSAGVQRQSVPSRITFDTLVDMIPQEAIQRAVERYQRYFWALTELHFRCHYPLALELHDIDQRISQFKRKSDRIIAEFDEKVRQEKASLRSPSLLVTQRKQPPSFDQLSSFSPILESGGLGQINAKTIPELAAEQDALDEEFDRNQNKMTALTFHGLCETQISPEQYQRIFGEEVAARLQEAPPVEDPYELCFALLYLIDQGDDLPWLSFSGFLVANRVCSSLPWVIAPYDPEDDEFFSYIDEETGEAQLGKLPVTLPKKLTPPEDVDWYTNCYGYKSFAPEERRIINLSQLVYRFTGAIPPRDQSRYHGALLALSHYGINAKRVTTPLLRIITLLGEGRHRSEDHRLDYPDPELPALVSEDESPESLKATISAQKRELEQLKKALHAAQRDVQNVQRQLEEQRDKSAQEHEELISLREVLFIQENEAPDAPVTKRIQLPYSVEQRTVVFGGHETWAKAIKPMLTGSIRFIPRGTNPNPDLIRNADVVWLQTNSLAHKDYYAIMNVARSCRATVKYFKYASAEKCAEQLALEELEE